MEGELHNPSPAPGAAPAASPARAAELNALYFHLISLGSHYALDLRADPERVREQLEPFAGDWHVYNPAKPGYHREGLSVTSLDGGLSGEKDLTSLVELRKATGEVYTELSFRTLTPVFAAVPAVHEVLRPFVPFLGRTHFLRFGRGGYFPYHRDSFRSHIETFRLFVPLNVANDRDFVFLLGNERLNLEAGRAYFINTRVEHALFSFAPASVHLVMNVELCPAAVHKVFDHLFSR